MGLVGFLALFLITCNRAIDGLAYSGYTRSVTYEDYVLVKCSNGDSEVMKWLMTEEGIDLWHTDLGGSLTFKIASTRFKNIQRKLQNCKEVGNVEEIVKNAEHKMLTTGLSKSLDWFDEYHDYAEIIDWWYGLSTTSELVTMSEIGKSFEGREIYAVSITENPGADLPHFYFQCLIHSREWISGASCMYVAQEILDAYYNDNERVVNILRAAKLVFIPVVNPDGYIYTWTVNRLWRKNKRPNPGSSCVGTDLNRNYDNHWGEEGSSNNPCSETFQGSGPASEPEIMVIQNYFLSFSEVRGAMDWHSFSQLILRPWGWTSADTPDEERLKKLSEEMALEIKNVNNMTYDPIKIIQLTTAPGGSIDWFYSEEANINNKYRAAGLAFELRDVGQFGFLLPPDQIIPTGQEIYPAVLHFIEDLLDNPLENPNNKNT